jgi:hypothetical protein
MSQKILRGAKASGLPVEQANIFEFAVNLKTAKSIGVTLPTSILLRADKVIEESGLCLRLAVNGHSNCAAECLLLGAKRTWPKRAAMSANDPKHTSLALP